MFIVHYHPAVPFGHKGKRDCHTLVECAAEEFDLELGCLETIDTSPSSGWWIVPGTLEY